tara:strand:- start:9388 stop:10728 length:1341 start_codon:yes stop_codon:yes gene_type:complete
MSFFSKILSFICIFIFLSSNLTSEDINTPIISSISFNSINYSDEKLSEESYTSFLREYVFSQPEYTFAVATEREKDYLLTSAVRSRFPTISGSIINDEVLDRKIDDFSSIRKRQDDSFDAVAEIRQPIYTGGKVNSQVRLARIERNNSVVKKRATLSELIIESNNIFLSATIYTYLYNHAEKLLNEILPFKEKMETRAKAGTLDPAEYALFITRLNTLQSSIFRIEASTKTYVANYENFFGIDYVFQGFPNIFINIDNNLQIKDSFDLDIKQNEYLASIENIKITRSDYLPQLGVKARYTEYDINKNSNDNDIRGGLYLSMPIFNFGKGWADIQAQKARSRASKFEIDIVKKDSKNRNNELITIIDNAFKTIEKLKVAFVDTQRQRNIIQDRILLSGFSPINLLDAYENEINQLKMLLETEFELLNGYYQFLHQNQLLINEVKISL